MDLLEQQRELEDSSLSMGAERFRRKLRQAQEKGVETAVGGPRKLMRDYMEPLTEAIRYLCERPGGGRRHEAVKMCRRIGYDTAAYMTLKVVLDSISRKQPVRQVAHSIVGLMFDELRYRRLRAEAPQLFRWKLTQFNTSSYHHMKRSLDVAARSVLVCPRHVGKMCKCADSRKKPLDLHDEEASSYPKALRVAVGMKLIDLMMQVTPLIEYENKRRRKGRAWVQEVYLTATNETLEWMQRRNNALEDQLPVLLPMLVPPKDWASGERGGYRFALAGKHHLVRCRGGSRGTDGDMPAVYSAVNAVQGTAWRINPTTYALVKAIRETGREMAGVPAFEEEPLPPKPSNIAEDEEAKKDWKRRAHQVHERNHVRRQNLIEFLKVWGVVERFKEADRFWFPMSLDFRGRMYPISNYLSPQGNDLSRGLLTFAEGKPLGERGAVALAIHGANMIGEDPRTGVKVDKLSLQERVNWIAQHTQDIQEVASNPMGYQWWTHTDKPLQFFSFAIEWTKFVQGGVGTICSLPVAMDGSCNGIQHLSAMLRDPVGAQSVNLVPSERPRDIYQDVAKAVHASLEREFSDPTPYRKVGGKGKDRKGAQEITRGECAQDWIRSSLVDRKLCKRPTMTFAYGSKPFGFREQLLSDFALRPLFGNLARTRASYMADLIWEALQTRVSGAYQTMAWLQTAARQVVSKTGQPLEWSTPLGFPCRQTYFKATSMLVHTVLAGKLARFRVYEETDKIDLDKQANAVAPNVVHSLDATHMMLVVNAAASAGLSSFSMVHDSFATVPADYWILNGVTREEFVRLYTEYDVVGTLYNEFVSQLPEDSETVIEPPPPVGDLDISVVRDSEYFFS